MDKFHLCTVITIMTIIIYIVIITITLTICQWQTTYHPTKWVCCSHIGQRKVLRFIYSCGSITRQSNVVAIIVTAINIDLTRQQKQNLFIHRKYVAHSMYLAHWELLCHHRGNRKGWGLFITTVQLKVWQLPYRALPQIQCPRVTLQGHAMI